MKYTALTLVLLLCFNALLYPAATKAITTTNLLSYWKLDESSGNAADSHGSNTLTNNNTVAFVAGKLNNAADLELGSTEGFSIADSGSTFDLATFTYTMWVNFESFPAAERPFMVKRVGTGNQRTMTWSLNGSANAVSLVTYTDGSSVGCNVNVSWSPSLATWYMVAVSKSGTSVKFYVNGSQQGTTQTCASATVYNGTAAFEVGQFAASPDYFDGLIDEASVWTRELTGTDISDLYNSGTPLAYPFSAGGTAARIDDTFFELLD
jgi:hypothetical protein